MHNNEQHQQYESENITDEENETPNTTRQENIQHRKNLLEKVKQEDDDYVVVFYQIIGKPFENCDIWTEDLVDLLYMVQK